MPRETHPHPQLPLTPQAPPPPPPFRLAQVDLPLIKGQSLVVFQDAAAPASWRIGQVDGRAGLVPETYVELLGFLAQVSGVRRACGWHAGGVRELSSA